MPPINPVLSAGVIAISMAVVAAIVVYENPEVRRMADDLKRRIAVAVQSLGDNMSPDGAEAARRRRSSNEAADEQPLFNRPEDAEGFLMSRGRRSDADPGVVADEATRRRQREELLYWNRQQVQRQNEEEQQSRSDNSTKTSWQPREALEAVQRATREAAAAAGIHISSLGINKPSARPSTSFDHFLRPDTSAADRGTYVMNTDETFGTTSSSNINTGADLLRRRRPEAIGAAYANPFADEYGIELDEQELQQQVQAYEEATKSKALPAEASAYHTVNTAMSSSSYDREDTMSDIYSATEPDTSTASKDSKHDTVFDPLPAIAEQQQAAPVAASAVSSGPKSEVFFDVNDYYTPSGTAGRASVAAGSNSNEAGSLASDLSQRLNNALAMNESYVNAGQSQVDLLGDDEMSDSAVNTEAFNSIQAWAQNSSSASVAGFYSPLPVTPTVAMSEPSVISSVGDGELTPTESMSIIGSVASSVAGSAPSIVAGSATGSAAGDYGVVSEDDSDGIMTPTSWSEVGSVVSENEPSVHA
ncbi:hypothetical protein F503_04457 [Ophiostoma piceae UAMH 11346]|uniref:Uncharacterized protein n=1 Tax=Ophiostoma piceae (strain UAMH 11346) TaxID=1262450 RepID=S3D649_OPHP1|nr:hypothetical protein F503_04457 [Ophiostoma piceae UAMH 11346]